MVRARLLDDARAEPLAGHRADLFTVPGFVSAQRCCELVALIDSEIRPSTLFHDGGGGGGIDGGIGGGIRTSSTHYFRDHPLALDLGRKIDALLGLERAHAEPLQGQRYRAGEEYRHHSDHFRQNRAHWQRERLRGGQRTWTAMLYLDAVEAGGATDFPKLGLAIAPAPGLLAVWNNIGRDGRPNPALLHAGMPVETGVKHVITQWYRIDPWANHQS